MLLRSTRVKFYELIIPLASSFYVTNEKYPSLDISILQLISFAYLAFVNSDFDISEVTKCTYV